MINETNHVIYHDRAQRRIILYSIVGFALLNTWLIPLDEISSNKNFSLMGVIIVFARTYFIATVIPYGFIAFQEIRNIPLSRFWKDVEQHQKKATLIASHIVRKPDVSAEITSLKIVARPNWPRILVCFIPETIAVISGFLLGILYLFMHLLRQFNLQHAIKFIDGKTIMIMSAVVLCFLLLSFISIGMTYALNVEVNSEGLIVGPKALLGTRIPGTIKWREATAYRKFTSLDGNLIYYDLHCADKFVRWTQIKRKGLFIMSRPSLSQQEYEQQFEQLDAIIQMRTGLTCVEI